MSLRDLPPDPLAYKQAPDTMALPGQPVLPHAFNVPAQGTATEFNPNQDISGFGGEFGRGLRSSGIEAFQAAPQALWGLATGSKSALKGARESMEEAANVAPFTSSYKDVKDISTGAQYLAGKTGELAPYLAAGLVASPGVAAAAMGAQAAGSQIAGHITPEGGLDVDPGKLGLAAAGTGVANAALAAVPFGRVLKGATEGTIKGALGHAATMSAANVPMTAVTQASETYLNPNRDKSQDTDQMIEAAIGGAAGMLGPGALSGALAKRVAKLPKPAAEPIKDPDVLKQKALEYKSKEEAEPEGPLRKVYGELAKAFQAKVEELAPTVKDTYETLLAKGKDAATQYKNDGDIRTYLGRILSDPQDTPTRSDAELLRTWALEGTPEELRAKHAEAQGVAAKYIPDILKDPAVPGEVKSFLSQEKVPGPGLDMVADWLEGKNAKTNTSFLKSTKDKINAAIAGFREARRASQDGATKRSEEAPDRTEIQDKVWQHLKPEFQTPEGHEQAKRLATLFATILSNDEKPSSRDMLKFGVANLADVLFSDPAKALRELGIDAGKRRAVEDAKDPNSFLNKAVSSDAAKHMTPSMRTRLGQAIDEFITHGLTGEGLRTKEDAQAARTKFADNLAAVFGTHDIASEVISHYQARYEKEFGGKEVYQPGLGDKEVGSPKPEYVFADKTRGRGFSLKQAYAKLDALRRAPETGGFADTTQFSIQSLADHVKETGENAKEYARRLYRDYERQIKEDQRHKNEKVPNADYTRGARANTLERWLKHDITGDTAEQFLGRHHVIKAEAGEENDLRASNQDLKKMRTGVDIKESTDPAIKEKQRAARFEVEFGDGRKETLDADSVRKAWASKTRADENAPGASGYRRNSFIEGLASIMAREDVVAIHGLGPDTVVDKELGTRYKDLSPKPEDVAFMKKNSELFQGVDDAIKTMKSHDTDQKAWDVLRQSWVDKAEGKKAKALVNERFDRATAFDVGEMTPKDEGITDTVKEITEANEKKLENTPRTVDEETGLPLNHPGLGKTSPAIKDLANPLKGAENIDPVKESMERTGSKEITEAEKQTIRDDYHRMFGDHVKVEFKKEFGWSGEWNEKDTATISTLATNSRSTGFHEAMHAFMTKLTTGPTERKMREQLLRVAESRPITRQLETLLAKHPEALEQVKNDREERLAYMFQFYKAGALKLGPDTKNIFNKIMDFIRAVTGTVSSYGQAAKYMDALYEGKFSDPSVAAQVIHDLKIETLSEKLKRTTGPLGHWADVVLNAKGDRLKNTGVDAFREIAQKFHRGVGEEQGGLGFLQRRQQQLGKFLNRYQDITAGMSQVELKKTLDGMRGTDQNPKLRALLSDVYDYMIENGVKRTSLDARGQLQEHDLGWLPNYFPRVYDKDAIMRDEAEFKKSILASNPGLSPTDVQGVYDHITKGTGYPELSDNEHQPGFTPFFASANERKIAVVDPKWLEQDMHKTMSTYLFQATHRAEYAKDFGNSGHVLSALLEKGKEQGATEAELKMAAESIKGYEGTLGADMNPSLRKFMAGVMVYENMAVLPFALFGSLTDPLGQLVRGGDFKDVWHAYGEGIKGLASDLLRRKEKGQDFDMARTLGLIDNANMLENFGELYNGMYMGKTLRKVNDAFFRWNGLEGWTQRMRVSAMVASERFILKHSQNIDPENSGRYMEELGLTKADVKELPDGRIAKTQEQGLTADQERRVQQAVFKWVDGAVVRPNAAHRPIWGSDPHWSLVFHLKQFGYSQHAVINVRVGHEWEHGNYMPALALLVYAPMMEASDLAQDLIAGHGIASGATGMYRAVARSGMLGKGQFGLDALIDPAYGGIPGQSFLGPAANHILYAAGTAAGAPQHSAHSLLFRSLPAGAAIRSATGN